MNEIEERLIKKYLGIPFKHLGRNPKEGLDCYGLIICIYRELGINVSDEVEYIPTWYKAGKNYFIEKYHEQWEKIITPHPFDVVLFNNVAGITNHAGVILSNGKFIHGSKVGVVISRITEKRFIQKLEGFYRHIDLC